MRTRKVKKKTRTTRNSFEHKLFDQCKTAGVKAEYETERIPYVLSGYYLPDFIIPTPLGKVYVEAKGHFRPEAKRKMVAVKRQHPELDIRIVFYRYSLKYERWAIKNGFRYAWSDIPDEWFKGL